MENACSLCYNLVLHYQPHSALKKISELKDSELFKCCCCSAYLHKHKGEWEIISEGTFCGSPDSFNDGQSAADSKSSAEEFQPYPLRQRAS